MPHPLDGCRAKVARAGDHLHELDRELRRFVDEHPYSFVVEPELDTARYFIKLHSLTQPEAMIPLRFGVMVGDVLHNLRSALDHLVWQLVILAGNTPFEGNQFPIFDTPKKFKEKRSRYLRGVRPEHAAAIEGHQPYQRPDRFSPLRLLAGLNDIDKHRIVHPGATVGATGDGTLRFSPNVVKAEITSRDFHRLQDGAVLYTIESMETTGGDVHVQSEVRYTVVFGEETGRGLLTSRRDLVLLRLYVANIIEDFTPEFG